MHTIKFVANHTGLSQHTIRAWERRYTALSPERTATNRRLYSAEDVEKLSLLHKAVQAGHSIGQIAGLSIAELERLPSVAATPPAAVTAATDGLPSVSYLTACLRAAEHLDARMLEDTLVRAAALLGSAALIERVLQPLLYQIGERWQAGEVRPAHEHMTSAIVRTFLGRLLDAFQPVAGAPLLVIATPVGQMHELGALIVAVTAASEGWRVLYLGANLPAADIAAAAHQAAAQAVALSIIFLEKDTRLDQELAELRRSLGPELPILAGGRAATAYQNALDSIQAISITDLSSLRTALEALSDSRASVPV